MFLFCRYSDKASLLAAINNIPYTGGNTDTYDGLRLMRTQIFGQSGDRSNFPNYAVVITDGQPTVNVDQLPGEIQTLQNSGIKVYVVGVTNQVNEATLQSISSAPHQVSYFSCYKGDRLKPAGLIIYKLRH